MSIPSKSGKSGSGESPEKASPAAEEAVSAEPAPPVAPKASTRRGVSEDVEAAGGGKRKAGKTAKPSDAGESASAKDAKPSLDDRNRPAAMEKPAQPDDLKMISGVGPKIEGILNDLGIYTFAQVASWKKAEREWVDGYLRFKGRIDRDDWVKQAKALAKGGRDEYVRVFGKEPR